MSRRAAALTARIAAVKRRLLAGGILQEVQWGVPGPRIRGNVYGQRTFTYTPLDALIEERPALERSTLATDRADDTVLTILDPVAITDSDTFRWGDHIYSVKKIDGVIKDQTTGTRYASEVTVIR